MTFMQIGQGLKEELKKTDNLTEEEMQEIRDGCYDQYGEDAYLYDKIEETLSKIYEEVKAQHVERKAEVLGSENPKSTTWTNTEIA